MTMDGQRRSALVVGTISNTLEHDHTDCKSVGLRLQWFESTTCHPGQTVNVYRGAVGERAGRGQPRSGVRVLREYSVTAINAAFAEWRSRASTVITGMWSGRVSALRTACVGCPGAPSNSLTAIRNGRLRAAKEPAGGQLACKRPTTARIIAPIAPRTRSSHTNQNQRWPGVPNR